MFGRLDAKLRRFYGTTLVDVASEVGNTNAIAVADAIGVPPSSTLFRSKPVTTCASGCTRCSATGRIASVRHDLEAVERRLVHDNYFVTVADSCTNAGCATVRRFMAAASRAICSRPMPWPTRPKSSRAILPAGGGLGGAHDRQADRLRRGVHPPQSEDRPGAPPARRVGKQPRQRCGGAANSFYGEGINRIQMHSFSYSPPGLPLPGWRMYAEIHLNRNVPWWPFMKPLNTWLARQQWLLQAGWPVADALVYPVKSNPDDGPFFTMGDRQPMSAANAVDAANEHTLARLSRRPARRELRGQHVVLLDELKTAAEEGHILALLDTGARVVCTHSLPATMARLAQRRRRSHCAIALPSLRPRALSWTPAPTAGRPPSTKPARCAGRRPQTNLVFQHRRVRDGDIYSC